MDKQGLWELFWKTGLPEAYLAIAGARQAWEDWEEPAKTAFQTITGQA